METSLILDALVRQKLRFCVRHGIVVGERQTLTVAGKVSTDIERPRSGIDVDSRGRHVPFQSASGRLLSAARELSRPIWFVFCSRFEPSSVPVIQRTSGVKGEGLFKTIFPAFPGLRVSGKKRSGGSLRSTHPTRANDSADRSAKFQVSQRFAMCSWRSLAKTDSSGGRT